MVRETAESFDYTYRGLGNRSIVASRVSADDTSLAALRDEFERRYLAQTSHFELLESLARDRALLALLRDDPRSDAAFVAGWPATGIRLRGGGYFGCQGDARGAVCIARAGAPSRRHPRKARRRFSRPPRRAAARRRGGIATGAANGRARRAGSAGHRRRGVRRPLPRAAARLARRGRPAQRSDALLRGVSQRDGSAAGAERGGARRARRALFGPGECPAAPSRLAPPRLGRAAADRHGAAGRPRAFAGLRPADRRRHVCDRRRYGSNRRCGVAARRPTDTAQRTASRCARGANRRHPAGIARRGRMEPPRGGYQSLPRARRRVARRERNGAPAPAAAAAVAAGGVSFRLADSAPGAGASGRGARRGARPGDTGEGSAWASCTPTTSCATTAQPRSSPPSTRRWRAATSSRPTPDAAFPDGRWEDGSTGATA